MEDVVLEVGGWRLLSSPNRNAVMSLSREVRQPQVTCISTIK